MSALDKIKERHARCEEKLKGCGFFDWKNPAAIAYCEDVGRLLALLEADQPKLIYALETALERSENERKRLLAEVKQLKSDLELVIRENAVGYDRLKQENERLLAIAEAAERELAEHDDALTVGVSGDFHDLRAALAAVDAPTKGPE